MKKIFGIFAITALFAACNNEAENTETFDSSTIITDTTVVAPMDTTTIIADTTQL
ncbi:MAG: hypothetical protein H0V30_00900 [Chitinophagaceae bacterium]|nr:hypothetical protein [Chitinophagaceae bacterium]